MFFSAKLYEVIFLLDKRENKNKDENLYVEFLMFCSKWSNNNGVTRPYMGKNKRQTSKNEDWVRSINENSSYGVPGFFKTMSQTLKVGMNMQEFYWYVCTLQNLIQHQIMRLCAAIASSS